MTSVARAEARQHGRNRWIAVAILLTGNFMNLIDVTIVNVALPTLQEELGAASNLVEWIVAGYTASFALLLLPSGRMGDIFGRRLMFLIGIGVFASASALCGLAPSLEVLVGARILQGAGAAMMTPQTLAFVPALFSRDERGGVFGLFALAAGLASVTGPILGGLLIGWDILGLSWRPIFLVNVPVAALAIAGALIFVPRIDGNRGLGIDSVGIALAGAAILAVLVPLIESPTIGWRIWMWPLVAAAPVLAWAFFRWQRRQEARHAPQLLPLRLARNPAFLKGTVLAGILFSGVPGFFLVIALFLQDGYGLTPLQSGLQTVPFSFGVLLASPVSAKLGDRFLRWRVAGGTLALLTCFSGLHFAVMSLDETIRWIALAPWLLIGGFGLGTTVSPLFQTALSGADDDDSGSASGAVQSLQRLGASFGVAIMGGLFFATLGTAAPGEVEAYRTALIMALWYAMAAVAAIGVFALVFGLRLDREATKRAGPPAVEG